MASSIDLYIQTNKQVDIERILNSNAFKVTAKPKRFAQGQIGTLYEISKNNKDITILAHLQTKNSISIYLLCLASPRSANFLVEVTDILVQAGAERTQPH